MESIKVEIWFSVQGETHYCGIGDGVHDGMYATGATKGEAAIKFIEYYNKSLTYNITDKETIVKS